VRDALERPLAIVRSGGALIVVGILEGAIGLSSAAVICSEAALAACFVAAPVGIGMTVNGALLVQTGINVIGQLKSGN
jgi:hypothetical protein